MPTYILRPDGTVTNAWNLNGAASAQAALNGTAVQPTAGDTTLFISANGNGTVCEVTVGTVTLGTETVTGLTVWEYGKADGVAGAHSFQAYKGTTALGTAGTTPDSGTLQWRSSVYSGALTQAEVDDLRIRFTNAAGGLGSNYAEEAYIELTTSAAATFVSATRTIKYDISNLVAATRTVKYNIFNMVSQTRTLKWDMAMFVSNTRALWWDVAGQVGATTQLVWNISAFVSATRTLKWNISANVSKTLTVKYDVAAFVNQGRTLVWNIGNVAIAGVLLPIKRRRGTYSPSAESSGPST